MIRKIPFQGEDDTLSSCVVAGDFIFLAHHAGWGSDIVEQVRTTFESIKHTLLTVNANLEDIVQLNFYIKDTADFRKGKDVFREYFKNGAPARMTVVTEFLHDECLCQMDGIAYKPNTTV